MIESKHLLLLLAVWLLVSSVFRFVLRMRHYGSAYRGAPETRSYLLQAALGALGGWCASLGILFGAGLFLVGQSRSAAEFLAYAGFTATTVDFVSSLIWPFPRTGASIREYIFPMLTFITGVALLSYVLWLRSMPGPAQKAVHLDLPVHGRSFVVAGGRDGLTNYNRES